MSSQLGRLLGLIGRESDEVVCILSQPAGQAGALHIHWTTVAGADSTVNGLGNHNIWYGIQPLTRPAHGRGRAADVTGVVALYADIDFQYEGKPGGIPRDMAMPLVMALSDILGHEPTAIVNSGHGLQPYWTVERLNPSMGSNVLAWWRQQVVEQANAMGLQIDSQVFDAARILRVPGPDNVKNPDEPAATHLMACDGTVVTEIELIQLMAKTPIVANAQVHIGPRGNDVFPGDVERVFTQEQAERYVQEHILSAVRSTPQGSGFNNTLNAAAFNLAAFIPEFFTDDQATQLLAEAVSVQFPAGPDMDDWKTIESGFGACAWQALKATPEQELNPFWEFADHHAQWEAGGAEVARSPRNSLAGESSSVVLIETDGDVTYTRAASRVGAPPAECYLPEEFWNSRPVLGQIRLAAWERMVCPEALLSAAFAQVIGHTMPNILIHGGIGNPTSLNSMFLLIGDPGSGKSGVISTARSLFDFPWAMKPYSFVPSSGQGIVAVFGQWNKPRGSVGEFVRTRYTACATVDESDTLRQLRSLKGSTLSSTLRSAAMGGMLGSHNANIETRTTVEPLTYSLSTILCAQPVLMDWLLNKEELEGGLPQRFLWTPTDPDVLVEGVTGPEKIEIKLPFEAWPTDDLSGNVFDVGAKPQIPRAEHIMHAPDNIQKLMRSDRKNRLLGKNRHERRNSAHVMLVTLKTASYLALMDGRSNVTDDDWELACMIVDASEAMMQWVADMIETDQRQMRRAAAVAAGKTLDETEVSRRQAEVARMVTTLTNRLERGPANHDQVMRLVGSKNLEEVLEAACDRVADTGDGMYSLI